MKRRLIISIILSIGLSAGACFTIKNIYPLTFISVLVITFLFSYKISDYIADFKTVENKSRIDIIFLLIFFVMLFIPMSHMSKRINAKNENRYLAQKAKLINHHEFNYNFGKDFSAWFDDRFALRDQFIQLDNILKCSLNQYYCGNKKVTFYKKGNLIYGSGYFGLAKIEENKDEILKTYADNLNKFNKYCKDNGIKLYLLIVPRAADFFDYKLADIRISETDQVEEVIDYIKSHTDIRLIYPKQSMLKANEQTPVYFKTDHHWTKKGAYVGYYEFMKEVKKDFPDVPILEENSLEKYYDKRVAEHWDSELNNGQTFKKLRLPKRFAKKILDTDYLYYKNPNRAKLQTDAQLTSIPQKGYKESEDRQFYYPDGYNKKVMLIGNSFGANFVEFLPYSFRYVVRYYDNYRYTNMSVYQPHIAKYKPDVIIVLFESCKIRTLLNMYPNPYAKKELE